MKMRLALCVMAVLCGLLVRASVKPGENLLLNSRFDGASIDPYDGQVAKAPSSWRIEGDKRGIFFLAGQGPDGRGIVRFQQTDPAVAAREVVLGQGGMQLVQGETYRLTALVRTTDFESPHAGIVVHNKGWFKDAGITTKRFPKNQDWTEMAQDFTAPETQSGFFRVALFACDFKGTLDISEVTLEAVSPKALADSEAGDVARVLNSPRLIPWTPVLTRIVVPEHAGAARPMATFLFSGPIPAGTAHGDYDLSCAVDDRHACTVPLKDGLNTLEFSADVVKFGTVRLNLTVVRRTTGEVMLRQSHEAAFVKEPAISTDGHKRLNNLVVELLNAPVARDEHAQTFRFSAFRDGWVYIALKNAAAPALAAALDNQDAVIVSTSPRLETFRKVSRGSHILTVNGATAGGTLVVRSIPELFGSCQGNYRRIPEAPVYDWAFMEKNVLPAITTINCLGIPDKEVIPYRQSGRLWLDNVLTLNASCKGLAGILANCSGMNRSWYQGTTCDEQYFTDLNACVPYAEALKTFVPKDGHILYTWLAGRPYIKGIHNDVLASCVNACHGQARLMSEIYCRTQPTRKEAEAYLAEHLVRTAEAFRQFYPNIVDHWGIVLGCFTQVPLISLAHHPQVDYKYYLDMQFQILANHPACRDLSLAGYWGLSYSEHEMYRWAFMLMRHYCIEGKTSMLSDEYGLSYEPGLIVNNDFDNGLDGWTPTGNVTTGAHKDYGKRHHNRWSSQPGTGDHLAVLTKVGSETSTLAQNARGFVPGKLYCLRFSTIEYNEMKANIRTPRRLGLNVSLGNGAEIDPKLSWVYVDKRTKGNYGMNDNLTRGNFHHVVFKALKPEIMITFENSQAKKGEAIAFNYVNLNPYVPEP